MTRLFIGNTDDDVYLVWFYCGRIPISCDTPWFYGGFHTPNLNVLPELEPIAELADGVILKVNKAYENADAYQSIVVGQGGNPLQLRPLPHRQYPTLRQGHLPPRRHTGALLLAHGATRRQ